ncbi:MAG: type IV toxin-antitoxin system AbiEi family antitoxin [Acidobacteriota bacterium]|nr:type IV toxin-antitoxin system AbiEi family antitoxin [Acidobacteriota bacterium]
MNREIKEKEILNEALRKFNENTGLTVEIIEIEPRAVNVGCIHDALIKIKWQDLDYFFAVKVKNNITRAALGGTIQQLHLFKEKGMLVTRYINPQIAGELKKMNIPFIDVAGNAYINEPPMLIFMTGNKPPDKYRLELPPRTFRPAGLQVIFALLCNPGLENAPLREIANKAVVALGTVGRVMYDLKRMNYLIEIHPRNRRLIRKENLLNRWVTAYPEQLRPKKMLGRFRADKKDWWKHIKLKDAKALLGGELAANILTKYLKPQIITIYAKPPIGRFLLKNKIKKDINGNIEILNVFWGFEHNGLYNELVPPLLIYADLLATGDARNIETARIIYERELTRLIRED